MRLRDYTAAQADRVLTEWWDRGYSFASDLQTKSTRLMRQGAAMDIIEEAQKLAEEIQRYTGDAAKVGLDVWRFDHGLETTWHAWTAKHSVHAHAKTLPELRIAVMDLLAQIEACQPLDMPTYAAHVCGFEPCAP